MEGAGIPGSETMVKETDIQAQIKKSIRRDGGYCHKLTNAFTIGIPDLLIALPPFAPCIIEVKDFKTCTQGFDRQIDVTPKQRYELNQITDVYPEIPRIKEVYHPAIGLGGAEIEYVKVGETQPIFSGIFVHVYWNKMHWLTGLPRHAERHTHALLLDATRTRTRAPGEYWDVRPLLEAIGVTKV